MKIFALILFLGIGLFFLTKKKPEPEVIKINNKLANKNCVVPNGANSTQTHSCSYIKGRAYYMVELVKHQENQK
ncbi:hypothetical protein FPF71_04500 [Algibacter amylolyticus]|uniref:Uncharacterized protein n=1 Tax=Algibacter amylolyticus TaxID=1608400 RepID=A0A5M7BFK1_9FLAO|nr:hypothetical protein [Algibacter amylolyticus]KAA5828099.1 hypothetical protein F2B50_04500 [Algibacter amylolyticus]MBB5267347.1 L-asparagine transporter-like permease [Algibacter amylolyticus]TSJ82344.1 hypothetical protein FPF71_04500 [Algibacter amylolyticus]